MFLITVKFESHYRILESKEEKYKDTWLRPSNFINALGLIIRNEWYWLAKHSVAFCNFLGSFLPESEDCLNILNAILHFLWYTIFSYPWGFIKFSCEYSTKHYIVVGSFIALGFISLVCYLLRDYLKMFFMYLGTFRSVQFILRMLKLIPDSFRGIKKLVIVSQAQEPPSLYDILSCWVIFIFLIIVLLIIGKKITENIY